MSFPLLDVTAHALHAAAGPFVLEAGGGLAQSALTPAVVPPE
jgi:hypothetical protein